MDVCNSGVTAPLGFTEQMYHLHPGVKQNKDRKGDISCCGAPQMGKSTAGRQYEIRIQILRFPE